MKIRMVCAFSINHFLRIVSMIMSELSEYLLFVKVFLSVHKGGRAEILKVF